MAIAYDCPSCQEGDHGNHDPVPGPVAEGIMGGWICICEGECASRPKPVYPPLNFEADDDMMERARKLEEFLRLLPKLFE